MKRVTLHSPIQRQRKKSHTLPKQLRHSRKRASALSSVVFAWRKAEREKRSAKKNESILLPNIHAHTEKPAPLQYTYGAKARCKQRNWSVIMACSRMLLSLLAKDAPDKTPFATFHCHVLHSLSPFKSNPLAARVKHIVFPGEQASKPKGLPRNFASFSGPLFHVSPPPPSPSSSS